MGIAATGLTDVKTYTIVVRMWLVNYATVSTTATFTASVTNCVVTGLSTTAVASQSYNIYTPQIQFTFVEFVQTPACAYTLDYTFWVYDSLTGTYSALPSFITQSAKIFTVVSTSTTDVATYQVIARGSVPTGYPSFSNELTTSLSVTNGCLDD